MIGMLILSILIFIFGIVFGSFYNVVIYRIPNNKSIIAPPSACGTCNTQLKPLDLIPIFSYIYLKGRCRYCGAKVSLQYPVIEFLTGVLFVLSFIYFGLSINFYKSILGGSLVLILSSVLLNEHKISNKLKIIALITLGIIYLI